MQQPIRVSHVHELNDGTAISLRLVKGIKAKEAHPGDVAEFVLDHDLWVGELLVARAGTPAQALVVEARKAKWASRGSKLAITISSLTMLDGHVLPLRGVPSYHGGVGPAAQIGGYVVEDSLNCPVCEIVFVPAALAMLIAPGTNRNVKAETIATAWVDGGVTLDVKALGPLQPNPASETAKIRIVRGAYGGYYSRDLYCNGVPLAHLNRGRKLELDLRPGYYRFAINPNKEVFETYLGPGSDTRLITDYDRVYLINDPESTGKLGGLPKAIAPSRSTNTTSLSLNPFSSQQKSELEYLQSAKPVDALDRYPAECQPLPEESGGENN
jgi:hypothetical protein